MAEPQWNPDTGGRSLAEILREAGIESASRSGRRRWDDPEEAGIRQRRAEAAASADRASYGRRRSDLEDAPPPPRDRPDFSLPAPGPTTAAIPGLRPDRKPGVPKPATPGAAPDRMPQRSGPRGGVRSGARVEEHPSTGPIPVVSTGEFDADLDADLEATPQESALAWLRFAGELVIAVAAGIAVYFAARLLWDWAPYAALLLAPLAVAGLTGGVGMWRQRQGREPAGALLQAALVFAGTLLTIAPAADLIARF